MSDVIGREELKARLDKGHPITLVMMLDSYMYERIRIPGSVHINTSQDVAHLLPDKAAEIVVYGTESQGSTSLIGLLMLRRMGYTNVRCYSGGLRDWRQAGYPVEGCDIYLNGGNHPNYGLYSH